MPRNYQHVIFRLIFGIVMLGFINLVQLRG